MLHWLTPLQGLNFHVFLFHRALPDANAHKAFSLNLTAMGYTRAIVPSSDFCDIGDKSHESLKSHVERRHFNCRRTETLNLISLRCRVLLFYISNEPKGRHYSYQLLLTNAFVYLSPDYNLNYNNIPEYFQA